VVEIGSTAVLIGCISPVRGFIATPPWSNVAVLLFQFKPFYVSIRPVEFIAFLP
jgi:hypothetical protein